MKGLQSPQYTVRKVFAYHSGNFLFSHILWWWGTNTTHLLFFLVTVWNPVQSFSVFICEKLNKPNHIHLSPNEIQSSQLIPFPVPQGGTSGELRGQWHDVIRGKKKKNIQFFLLLKDSGFNLFPCHLIIIKNFNMEICSFCIFKEMPFLNTRQQIRQTHLTPAYALTLKTNKQVKQNKKK